MTTENQSVLEKLRELKSDILYEELVWKTHRENEGAGKFETQECYWRSARFANQISNLLSANLRSIEPLLPRLIAALEMVEAKAKEQITGGGQTFLKGVWIGERDFARELLAVLEREK